MSRLDNEYIERMRYEENCKRTVNTINYSISAIILVLFLFVTFYYKNIVASAFTLVWGGIIIYLVRKAFSYPIEDEQAY